MLRWQVTRVCLGLEGTLGYLDRQLRMHTGDGGLRATLALKGNLLQAETKQIWVGICVWLWVSLRSLMLVLSQMDQTRSMLLNIGSAVLDL